MLRTVILLVLICSAASALKLGDGVSDFKLIWNMPTIQCEKTGVNFESVLRAMNISLNRGDEFRGDVISLLYDPGEFPALVKGKDGTYSRRNGGLPQFGSVAVHLEKLVKDIIAKVPEDFEGVAVIDMEDWRPTFRQNYGAFTIYKNLTLDLVKKEHPEMTDKQVLQEATESFEEAARPFMEETINMVKKLRPKVTWGYYAYPYCYNMIVNNDTQCSSLVQKENDKLSWLYSVVDGYYPSVYMAKSMTPTNQYNMIKGRLLEADRLGQLYHHDKKYENLPYFWYRYNDVNEFLSKADLHNCLKSMVENKATGVLIWGKSDDMNTKDKCVSLLNYVENVLAPTLKELDIIN